jgi:hypothetical protein
MSLGSKELSSLVCIKSQHTREHSLELAKQAD